MGSRVAEAHSCAGMHVGFVVEGEIAVCIIKKGHVKKPASIVRAELVNNDIHDGNSALHRDCESRGRGEWFVVDIRRGYGEHFGGVIQNNFLKESSVIWHLRNDA